MGWISTKFEGVFLFEPRVFADDRGYFFESFSQADLPNSLKDIRFVQDNESSSTYGVVRGLHYQLPPFAQSKLVRCVQGSVLDVIVDIRPDSDTYGQHEGYILDDATKHQLFVPHGFAHGYTVLSETAIFAYKCDQYYNKQAEGSISPLDSTLNIEWLIPASKTILSEKDQLAPAFGQHLKFEHK